MNINQIFKLYYQIDVKFYRIVMNNIILSLFFLLQSCENFTETDMPISEINATSVFEERNTANAAMTDIYAQIRDNGLLSGKPNGISKEIGLYTDELTWYGSSSLSSANFYNNTIIPSMVTVSSWWNSIYSQIYAANAVIEGVSKSTKLQQTDVDQLKGEAKFVRGLLHFYLLQLWGDIPYITSTDYNINTKAVRVPSSEVYVHIIEDLTEAANLLPDEYLTSGRVRPNSYAANALLARVYLFNGSWVEAINSASVVINNATIYTWEENLNNVFLKGSTTAIWQLMPRTTNRNTDEATTFFFSSGPPPLTALSENLIDSFESGDLRKVNWTKVITKGTSSWSHSFKYKKSGTSSPPLEYSIVLRLAEQYLIRAEARAQQDDLIGAKEDLNKIRNRAGLSNTNAESKSDILNAILQERRVELFTEYGHRFFDLKRSGRIDEFLLGIKSNWSNTKSLLPIPEAELKLNPNISPQNPGY
jgi:hypothetical protein